MTQNIRVILADDHQAIRAGLRMMLQRAAEIEVVGEAANGQEAIELVDCLEPDILLLDMEMPVLNGVETARRLKSERAKVKVLALSAYADSHYVLELLAAGAAGYLTKDEAPTTIVEAVRRVAQGETGWLSRRIQEQLKNAKHATGRPPKKTAHANGW